MPSPSPPREPGDRHSIRTLCLRTFCNFVFIFRGQIRQLNTYTVNKYIVIKQINFIFTDPLAEVLKVGKPRAHDTKTVYLR